jgi:cytochrome c oxidase cbb3-type subunit I
MKAPLPSTQCSCVIGQTLDPALAASCRVPVLLMLFCAAAWLVSSSLFGLVVSLKFHNPSFLADSPWLTYGRIQPAQTHAFLYGFALQAAWATALWMLVRLGRTPLRLPGLVITGTVLWNVGLKLGTLGILAGHRVGFDGFDLPRPITFLLFGGYLCLGIPALLTLRARREPALCAARWFILTALFWFPWIYSTASALLVFDPVRGVMQTVVHAWYLANLHWIALGFIALAILFNAIPRLIERPLHSQYQALAAFWMLALFVTWTGIPNTTPLPAWIPSVSTVFTVLTIVPLIAIAQNFHLTLAGAYPTLRNRWPLAPAVFSLAAFLIAGLLTIAAALPAVAQLTQFTFFTPARQWLFLYGFVAMALFTGLYLCLPDLIQNGFPSGRLVKIHVWAAAIGVTLQVVPLLLGGIAQGLALNNPEILFIDTLRPGLIALRISTLGDLLLLAGHVALFANLIMALVSHCRRACRPLFFNVPSPLTAEVPR